MAGMVGGCARAGRREPGPPRWINPVVYAEVSVGFSRIEDVEEALPADDFPTGADPPSAAGVSRRQGVRPSTAAAAGERKSTLPDFFIGAHAAVVGLTLLTRDQAVQRTSLPVG